MFSHLIISGESNCSETTSSDSSGMLTTITSFLGRIISLGHTCTNDEMQKANETKAIHDAIEEIAYQAMAKKIIDLGISGSSRK